MENYESNDRERTSVRPNIEALRSSTGSDQLELEREDNAGFLEKLRQKYLPNYEPQFLFFMFSVIWLVRGFSLRLHDIGMNYVLCEYNLEAPTMEVYRSVIVMPWALKPLYGSISDNFPIRGYRKSPYICITTCVAIFLNIWLGLSDKFNMSATLATLCIVSYVNNISATDILAEARVSENIKQKPTTGPDSMTILYLGNSLWQLFGALISGPLIFSNPRYVYLAGIIPFWLVLYPVYCDHMGEANTVAPNVAHPWRRQITANCYLVGISALLLGGAGLLHAEGYISPNELLGISSIFMALNTILPLFLIPRQIAHLFIFLIVQTVCCFQLESGSFYFFTDDAHQFPGGPNFSLHYFTMGLGAATSAFAFVGYMFYYAVMKHWTYKNVIIFGNILLSVCTIVSVCVYTRYNLELGIPDKIFVLGNVVTQAFLYGILWIPSVVIIAHACPVGLEASVFGLLAGAHNIGSIISAFFGSRLLLAFDVRPSGKLNEGKEFDNLWKCAVIQGLMPFVTLVMVPVLLPDLYMHEKWVITDPDYMIEEGTETSPLLETPVEEVVD